jgi:hypothetical protein
VAIHGRWCANLNRMFALKYAKAGFSIFPVSGTARQEATREMAGPEHHNEFYKLSAEEVRSRRHRAG